MSGVNKAIIDMYLHGNSIPMIADETGLCRSTVRRRLFKAGVLRTRSEGIRLASQDGRLGAGNRGKSRVFSDSWRQNLSAAKKAAADKTASGLSVKPNGYVEVTRGEHKGRGQHRVIAEELLGRPLAADECVHHIDGNRANNSPENLQVMSRSEHASLHGKENINNRMRDQLGRLI